MTASASIRALVRARADARCEYCRLLDAVDEWPFHVDHVVPLQHGGTDETENLCWACSRCNLYKGPNVSSVEPGSGAIIPLFRPRMDAWETHFRHDRGHIVGITPTGRVTVRLLMMNASNRVELRKRLARTGEL